MFLLTGGKPSIMALGLVSRAADGIQLDAVVGATGDAPHQAVGVQGVTFGFPTRGHQGGYVGAGSGAGRPSYIGHGLGDLAHVHSRRAARTSGRTTEIKCLCWNIFMFIFFSLFLEFRKVQSERRKMILQAFFFFLHKTNADVNVRHCCTCFQSLAVSRQTFPDCGGGHSCHLVERATRQLCELTGVISGLAHVFVISSCCCDGVVCIGGVWGGYQYSVGRVRGLSHIQDLWSTGSCRRKHKFYKWLLVSTEISLSD